MLPRPRRKKPRRPRRLVEASKTPARRIPPAWADAMQTLTAAFLFLDAHRFGEVGDERVMRRDLLKALPLARTMFEVGHGEDDGQTCNCRMYALLAILAQNKCGADAPQVFEANKRFLQGYLQTVAEVN
jgi:hypothetical protein